MTLTVKHQKVSSIADDPAAVAAGQVVPSDWNAEHAIDGLDAVFQTSNALGELDTETKRAAARANLGLQNIDGGTFD